MMARWRLGEPRDADSVVAMFLALNQEDPGPTPVDAEQMRRTIARLRSEPWRGRLVVLDVEGQCAGYALLIAYWSNELGGEVCTVDEMFVAEPFRGHGYATQLMDSLARENQLWPSSPVALALEVSPENTRAKALYTQLGFAGRNLAMRRLL